MKFLKIKFIVPFILLILAFSFNTCKAQNGEEQETTKKDWKDVLETTRIQTEYAKNENIKSLIPIVALIIQDLLSLLGVIFIIFTLYAGYLWMTAGGSEENISKAKTIIKNSVAGLVITLSAYAITYYIMKNVIQITTEGTEKPGYYIRLEDDTGN